LATDVIPGEAPALTAGGVEDIDVGGHDEIDVCEFRPDGVEAVLDGEGWGLEEALPAGIDGHVMLNSRQTLLGDRNRGSAIDYGASGEIMAKVETEDQPGTIHSAEALSQRATAASSGPSR
jgi:hypothetical protein